MENFQDFAGGGPIYQERVRQLCDAAAAHQLDDFVALLPRTERFFDVHFLHGALEHVAHNVAELGGGLSESSWVTLFHSVAPACLPLDDIEAVLTAAERHLRLQSPARTALSRAQRRFAFQREINAACLTQTPPVSIGLHCMGWMLLGRWGFRTGAKGLRTFSPLSLAHHNIEAVISLLREGGAGYATPESLRVVRSANGVELTGRRDGRILWNHHIGTHWHAEEFAFFRARTEALVSDLEVLLDTVPFAPMNFVLQYRMNDESRFQENTARVWEALSVRVRGPFSLTVINDLWRTPAEVVLMPAERTRPKLRVIYASPPSQDYVWHDPQHWDTQLGQKYEHAVASALREVLQCELNRVEETRVSVK